MSLCTNCAHLDVTHDARGCSFLRGAPSGGCGCPFDGSGRREADSRCPGVYTFHSNVVIYCDRPVGHSGEHEGQYPGDIQRSTWKDKPVADPDRVKAADAQVGGNHYTKFKIQPWAVIDEYSLDYYRGNVLKYLLRAGHKGSKLEDLKKARHYLDRAIEIEEGK